MFLALFAGYPIYALIAAFTGFTLVPDTKGELFLLGALTGLAVIGKVMDLASEGAAERGDPAALKYRRDWGLDKLDRNAARRSSRPMVDPAYLEELGVNEETVKMARRLERDR